MSENTKRILAALAVGAAFSGIAIALMVDMGVTARWNEAMSARDGREEPAQEEGEAAEDVTPRPAP